MNSSADHKSVSKKTTQPAMRRKLRHFYDSFARYAIAIGGCSVIVAITLIFFYLIYEVLPLFKSAQLELVNDYHVVASPESRTLHLAVEEQSELGMRLSDNAELVFFELANGTIVQRELLSLPASAEIVSFGLDTEDSGVFALGLSNGQILIAQYSYATSYAREDNRRILTPQVEYPFGREPFSIFNAESVATVALRGDGDNLTLAATNPGGQINLTRISKQSNLMSAFSTTADTDFEVNSQLLNIVAVGTEKLFIDGDRRWLYSISNTGIASLIDLRAAASGQSSEFTSVSQLIPPGGQLADVSFLLGGLSLLVAANSGEISQWFLVRNENGAPELEKIRQFKTGDNSIVAVTPEQRRKNFVMADTSGYIGLYNTTSHSQVFGKQILNSRPASLAISPRGDALLVELADGGFSFWDVHNEHPEVSISALWGKVWYENYDESAYIWQSSASNNDFEPKYSLVPLSFGTLKAAFYAMLLAAPLAICGAIFTGYFMAPAMRRKVKPLIELMEALPTVVLGFLAGLWLAPFVENNLLSIFSVLVLLPLGILLTSFGWSQLPRRIRYLVPDGWEAALLLPVIIFFTLLAFVISGPIESVFFGGDMRFWISNDLGISYDQRNAMVVGFAMGFAVIPTIFSIAEDAIFTVPKHLTYGSLALGATPWQSLYRVVLPTASPGIFSGLMIGFGRAVGETMIVLMATGNTPIMDMNIFEGMRTLAANIAVEIPESEVDSTHYRILFLAALVLFMFTFVFNTVAEIVRQRLRSKYSTI